MMKVVSHREFTRVKNSFGNSHLHYYTVQANMKRTLDDDWSDTIWRLNGERDDLLYIHEKHGKKEYFVSEEAYRILRILKQYGLRQEDVVQTNSITW